MRSSTPPCAASSRPVSLTCMSRFSADSNRSPTGREVEIRTIDVLTLADGLITALWVVSDELGMLAQLGAVELV